MEKDSSVHFNEQSANSAPAGSSETATPLNRRSFLGKAAAVAALAGAPSQLRSQQARQSRRSEPNARSTFLDLLRIPDKVIVYSQLTNATPLSLFGTNWQGRGVDVETRVADTELAIRVHAPRFPVRYIHVRWSCPVTTNLHVLGDHWERSYGDLGWRNLIPERVMPWYFATYDGSRCNAYGVKTSARSLCFWQLDPQGVSLWLNLSNGGSGVELGERVLAAATVVTRNGNDGEDSTRALRVFCRQMCSKTALPFQPVYGTNDWYYAYGKNTADQILNDTSFIADLTSTNEVRPFSVIDMGWAVGPPKFPNMPELASQIRRRNVRPGIWIRPLQAPADAHRTLLLSHRRFGEEKSRSRQLAYDPTISEAQEKILAKVKQVVDWGFDLVKHDFSTYDLLGRWGFEMGAEPTAPGWSLHDQSRTNAEVILDLYQSIRGTCQHDTLIVGCNTIGHLAQGYFDVQRTGDDTSGRVWERTRRMGINTLAFRLPQHQAFFIQDADCVGISADIPWEVNRQWLDLLAQSGTTLFVSPGEGSRNRENANVIKGALRLAASGGNEARPLDLLSESTPQKWAIIRNNDPSAPTTLRYDWSAGTGAFPFKI